MSKETEQAMHDAIKEHFSDEGLTIDGVGGVLVRLLAMPGGGPTHPAHYSWAPGFLTNAALTNSAAFDHAWAARSYAS